MGRFRSVSIAVAGLVLVAVVVYFVFFNSSSFLQPSLPVPVVSVAGNWAGYVAGSNLFFPQPSVSAVSASWTVPTVTGSGSNSNQYSSAWVGIGGQFDSSLIQVGTEHDIINGAPSYSAWYEMLPATLVTINSMHLSPGDQMQASVNLADANSNTWTITIKDSTTGQSFQQNFQYTAGKLSADWIVERPSLGGSLTNLANFGTVTFTDCQATIGGRTGGITDFADNRIYMEPAVINNQTIQLVNVSGVNNAKEFSVNYIANP